MPTGLAMDLAYDDSILCANRPGCGGTIHEEDEDGMWLYAGPHDVESWVHGVVRVGTLVLRRTPGRLVVAERQ